MNNEINIITVRSPYETIFMSGYQYDNSNVEIIIPLDYLNQEDINCLSDNGWKKVLKGMSKESEVSDLVGRYGNIEILTRREIIYPVRREIY